MKAIVGVLLLFSFVIAGPVSRAGAMAEGSGELQGGTFGVGIETSTGGTIMLGVGSGSATLPRLVTFQWTPLAPGPRCCAPHPDP